MFGTGRVTLWEVCDQSGDPQRGPERVGDRQRGLGRAQGGPGQLGGPSRRSETGRGTHVEVWDGSGDP